MLALFLPCKFAHLPHRYYLRAEYQSKVASRGILFAWFMWKPSISDYHIDALT